MALLVAVLSQGQSFLLGCSSLGSQGRTCSRSCKSGQCMVMPFRNVLLPALMLPSTLTVTNLRTDDGSSSSNSRPDRYAAMRSLCSLCLMPTRPCTWVVSALRSKSGITASDTSLALVNKPQTLGIPGAAAQRSPRLGCTPDGTSG